MAGKKKKTTSNVREPECPPDVTALVLAYRPEVGSQVTCTLHVDGVAANQGPDTVSEALRYQYESETGERVAVLALYRGTIPMRDTTDALDVAHLMVEHKDELLHVWRVDDPETWARSGWTLPETTWAGR